MLKFNNYRIHVGAKALKIKKIKKSHSSNNNIKDYFNFPFSIKIIKFSKNLTYLIKDNSHITKNLKRITFNLVLI